MSPGRGQGISHSTEMALRRYRLTYMNQLHWLSPREKEVMTSFGHSYFSQNYPDYYKQNPAQKLDAYLHILRRHNAAGKLLDIGCSYGLFVQRASQSFSAVGMDVSFETVAAAAKDDPASLYLVGKLPDIPFKQLDVITLLDVIEHLPHPEMSMAAIKAALRPGGIALVVVPVYDGPLGWLVRKLDKDPTHIHKESRKFWLDLVQRHFALLEWQGAFRKLISGKFYLHFPTKLLRKSSPAIIMVMQRAADEKPAGIRKAELS